jgi:hypothetical protein
MVRFLAGHRPTSAVLGALSLVPFVPAAVSGQVPASVQWINVVNATPSGGTLVKTAGCSSCSDAGGTSAQFLTGDGYVEFTPAIGTRFYAGLSSTATPNTDPALIEYAFSFWADGGWDVRERNQYRTEGRFAAGDFFRVALVNGSVTYYKNGVLVHSSRVRPLLPMALDTTLIGSGSAIKAAVLVVLQPPSILSVAPSTSPKVASFYSQGFRVTGSLGTYSWSVVSGSLPEGLTVDPGSGTVSGIPVLGGRFSAVIRATSTATSTVVLDQVLSLSVLAAAPPSAYDAVSDRSTRVKGLLPAPGAAGSEFVDPVFGTRLMRVTDGAVRPGAPDRSFRTPSSVHANAWSADGRYFYTVSTDGTIVPFAFDRATMRAQRLNPAASGEGGLTLRFFNEPTFSYVMPGVAYGTLSGPGANLRSVDQYDFQTGQYSRLIDLDSLVPGLASTYTGGLYASAGPVERVIAFFGGTGQDRHFYLVAFDKANPANRRLVDTVASTVDGRPTSVPLNFRIHAAAIDRSGQFITIYPTGADLQAPRSAAPAYVWDILSDTFTPVPLVAGRAGGHDAYGFGYRVNQDCCTRSTWDAGQWQFRGLANPLVTSDLVTPVLLPKEIYMADHPSWHNAQPDRLVPFVDATYRYGTNTAPWRAWDDEIFAVQTDGAGGAGSVWRFAHHRSAVEHDVDPSRISFWYTPRVNVSPDGRWALFTSNWEKTLGTDPRGEVGGRYRQDVFLVQLAR